jgi:NADH-quinone oxidoreductase subunit J
VEGHGAPYAPGPRTYGTPAYIGRLLLTRFLLAFEVASFLLLIAAVGGVVLARRRGGLEQEDEREVLTPLDLLRPRATGTTAEAVGTIMRPGAAIAEDQTGAQGQEHAGRANGAAEERTRAGTGSPSS